MPAIADSDPDPVISPDDSDAAEERTAPETANTELSNAFDEAKSLTIRVNPARLAPGRYDHGTNRNMGEGDIHASYSADRIAFGQSVRKPFPYDGQLWICTSIKGSGLTSSSSPEYEAYRITVARVFSGTPTSYGARTGTSEAAEAARNDPNGFYHGMTVARGPDKAVLSGPPVAFVADNGPARPDRATSVGGEQLSLF